MKRTVLVMLCWSWGAWAAPEATGGTTETAPDAGAAAADTRPPLKVDKMPFSQESIREVVAYHQDEIQACYEQTLADKSKVVEGKLMTSFVITREGKVRDAKVLKKGTTLKEPRLHVCVTEILATMVFPKPYDRREHPVEYPFNLKAIR
jgi:hypothetical protein